MYSHHPLEDMKIFMQIAREKLGMRLCDVAGDGNCFFRAIVAGIEGKDDNISYKLLKEKVADDMEIRRE